MYNKAIAEFMGYTYYPHNDPQLGKYEAGWKLSPHASQFTKHNTMIGLPEDSYLCRQHTSLKFHSDWNWFHKAFYRFRSFLLPSGNGLVFFNKCEEIIVAMTNHSTPQRAFELLYWGIMWYQDIIKNPKKEIMDAEQLLEMLADNKGRIVSTSQLSEFEISQARLNKRIYINKWGYGFVYIPDVEPESTCIKTN